MEDTKDVKDKTFFSRYLDGLYTQEDVNKLQEEIKDLESSDSFEKIAGNEWEESISHAISDGRERERYKKEANLLLNRIERRNKFNFKRISIAVASIAAMVCLVIGVSTFRNYWLQQQTFYIEAYTSYGERKTIFLPDGTELVLNSCSKVRYPNRFIDNERRIEFEGEGYFQVERNEKHPFIVNTSNFDVLVLGTSFNVKSYSTDELVSVNVESGKVQVNMPEAMMRLKANEQVCINTKTGNFQKMEIETDVAQWQEGTLYFNQTPIHDVAKELERIYNCTIVFADGEFTNLITGKHENKSLEDVLSSLEYVSGIHYKKEGNHIILFK